MFILKQSKARMSRGTLRRVYALTFHQTNLTVTIRTKPILGWQQIIVGQHGCNTHYYSDGSRKVECGRQGLFLIADMLEVLLGKKGFAGVLEGTMNYLAEHHITASRREENIPDGVGYLMNFLEHINENEFCEDMLPPLHCRQFTYA